jgi:glycosyltransferase involved in cell wall biosynthesis
MDAVLLSSSFTTGAGGVQTVLRDLARGIQQNGRPVRFVHETSLPRIHMVEAENALGYRSFGCPMPVLVKDSLFLSVPILFIYVPVALYQLIRLLRRERIAVINAHYLEPYFVYLALAGWLTQIPVVISVHGADVDVYHEQPVVRRLACYVAMRLAARIVACSNALAVETVRACPDARAKVTVIHNALGPSQHRAMTTPDPLPTPFILCVSRHVAKKGIDILLRAFVRIAADVPDASLVLVGDGPLFEQHRRLAESLGVERPILFVGSIPQIEVKSFIDACAVFVLPSRSEPFGVVILEAARSGKAIVATRVGGVPEILTDGVDALLVNPDDPDGLAAHVVRLLRSPALRDRLGDAAQRTLRTRFSWTRWIADYLDTFEANVGRSRAVRA